MKYVVLMKPKGINKWFELKDEGEVIVLDTKEEAEEIKNWIDYYNKSTNCLFVEYLFFDYEKIYCYYQGIFVRFKDLCIDESELKLLIPDIATYQDKMQLVCDCFNLLEKGRRGQSDITNKELEYYWETATKTLALICINHNSFNEYVEEL